MKANGELPEHPTCTPGYCAEDFVTDCSGKICNGFGCAWALPSKEYNPVANFRGAAGSEVYHDLVHGDGANLRVTLPVRSYSGAFAREGSRIAVSVAGCNGGDCRYCGGRPCTAITDGGARRDSFSGRQLLPPPA